MTSSSIDFTPASVFPAPPLTSFAATSPQKSICMLPISQVRHHQVYPGRATRLRLQPGLVLSLYIAHRSHCRSSWPHATAVCGRYTALCRHLQSQSRHCSRPAGVVPGRITYLVLLERSFTQPRKTDAILLGTSMRSKTISNLNTINVAGTPVALSDSIKILGVVLDKNLTFDSHISHVSKSFFYHIRALRHIWPALTDDVAKMVACSLVGSRLDYANSVLFGTSAKNLARLHRIQSTLARVITMQRGWISISKTLSDLHWLPIKFRIDFKVAILTFNVFVSGEPGYLYSRIGNATSRTLRSSADIRKLSMIPSRTKIGTRAFSALSTAGLEQSTTGHSQCFIHTIVQVKIKNSLLQIGLQLMELDLHCASDSASRWHCTLCLLRSINGHNNNNNNKNNNNK